VRDIKIHPRDHDLIVATHGRGIWILDDITPLRKIAQATKSEVHLFEPRPAVRWTTWNRDANRGSKVFVADNPPYGALVYYYLKSAPVQPVTLAISDERGNVIRTLRPTDTRAGVNLTAWDLRHETAQAPAGGRGGGRGGGAAPWAVPGPYMVTLRAAGQEVRAPVRVEPDPRITLASADYVAQTDAALQLRDLIVQADRALARMDAVRNQLQQLDAALRVADQTGAVKAADGSSSLADAMGTVRTALQKVVQLRDEKMTRPIQGLGYRQYPRLREELNSLAGQINGAAAPPTKSQLLRLGELRAETGQVVTDVETTLNTVIRDVNSKIAGKPFIIIPE
jgi:hypothetical protein